MEIADLPIRPVAGVWNWEPLEWRLVSKRCLKFREEAEVRDRSALLACR